MRLNNVGVELRGRPAAVVLHWAPQAIHLAIVGGLFACAGVSTGLVTISGPRSDSLAASILYGDRVPRRILRAIREGPDRDFRGPREEGTSELKPSHQTEKL